jgi:membrane protease YdiL (CAAX protease family)
MMLFEARGYFLPQMMKIPWDFWLIFSVLGVLIPWRGAVRVRRLLRLPQITPMDRLTIYARTIAFQWVLTAIVVWRCLARGLSADDLGFVVHKPVTTALVTGAMLIYFGILQYIGIRRMAAKGASFAPHLRRVSAMLMPRSAIESLGFIALAVTASLCEEFLYRAFAFAAILRSTSSFFLAVLGSSVLFALAHVYQGKRGILTTFILGLIMAASRIWPGSIIPAIFLHLLVDLMAGLLAPRYFNKPLATELVSQ